MADGAHRVGSSEIAGAQVKQKCQLLGSELLNRSLGEGRSSRSEVEQTEKNIS
jgi:hypothetical protein